MDIRVCGRFGSIMELWLCNGMVLSGWAYDVGWNTGKISLIGFRHFSNEEILCHLSLGMCRVLELSSSVYFYENIIGQKQFRN